MKSLTKIIAILVGGAVISLLLVTFFVTPMLNEVTAINSDIRSKKVDLAVLDQQIQAFKNAQSDLAKATRKDDILNAFLTKENLVQSVLDLEKASNQTKITETLQIKDLGPKDKPSTVLSERSGIVEVPYELTTIGDFAGTVNFISYLEHLPHFTELSSFTLSSILGSTVNNTTTHTGQVFADFNGIFFIKSVSQ